jgi:hypothetical protein
LKRAEALLARHKDYDALYIDGWNKPKEKTKYFGTTICQVETNE